MSRMRRRLAPRALPWLALAALVVGGLLLWRAADAPGGAPLAPDALPPARAVPESKLPEAPVPASPLERSAAELQPARMRTGRAEEAARLHGTTVDVQGQPLEGVEVTFRWLRDGGIDSVLVVASSDAQGRFELEPFGGPSKLLMVSASRGEYDLFDSSPVERDAEGAWRPVELVLTPTGRLNVLVLDAAGLPVEGVLIDARVEEAEASNFLVWRAMLAPRCAKALARTDGDGRVELEVSSRRLLELRVHRREGRLASSRVWNGELSRDERGDALVLDPGERLELVVRPPRSLVIEGRVVRADGTAVQDGQVRLFDGDPSKYGILAATKETSLDEAGRFRFVLPGLAEDARLTLVAVDGSWFVMRGREMRGLAWGETRVDEAVDGVVTLELVVERLLELSGRVLDAEGASFPGTVWAVPSGTEYVLQKGRHGLLPLTLLDTEQGGAFTINGLLPGEYDIIVKRGRPRTYHRFAGYNAGERGIELRITEDRVVHLRLQFSGGGDGLRIQPVLLTHQYRQPSSRPRVATPTRTRVQDCAEWDWPQRTGVSTAESPLERTIWRIEEWRDADEHRFDPQQSGWYSVGARATDAAGRPYVARLSEPCYLEAGEYEFVLALEPTTCLAGVTTPGEWVEVLDARDRPVLTSSGERRVQADGRGAFRFDGVPLGPLRVRSGSPDGLQRGEARVERSTQAVYGASLDLNLE